MSRKYTKEFEARAPLNNNNSDRQKLVLTRTRLSGAGYAKRAAYGLTFLPVSAVLGASALVSFVASGLVCYPAGLTQGWNPFAGCSGKDPYEECPQARSYDRRHAWESQLSQIAEAIFFGGEAGYYETLCSDADYKEETIRVTVLSPKK